MPAKKKEMEEEPTEHLKWRQMTKTAKTAGKHSDPPKDGMPAPHTENSTLREEPEPVRTEPVIEVPAEQARPAGQETTRPETLEPEIQVSPSPSDQVQAERERPAEACTGE